LVSDASIAILTEQTTDYYIAGGSVFYTSIMGSLACTDVYIQYNTELSAFWCPECLNPDV